MLIKLRIKPNHVPVNNSSTSQEIQSYANLSNDAHYDLSRDWFPVHFLAPLLDKRLETVESRQHEGDVTLNHHWRVQVDQIRMTDTTHQINVDYYPFHQIV